MLLLLFLRLFFGGGGVGALAEIMQYKIMRNRVICWGLWMGGLEDIGIVRTVWHDMYKRKSEMSDVKELSLTLGSDLGLEEDHSVEYGVRQCQEMASVVSRLINDGQC